ncbi:MAG: rhomboid family intramembrane serine protease [Myxococcales bacterium]|nr:rhomboid family intramembrane serine protease [Myxococcales bacterium]
MLRDKLPPHLGDAVIRIGLICIVVQVVLFAGVYWVAPGPFTALWRDWLSVTASNVGSGRIWTLLTYGFVHDLGSPLHLVFNLVALYFLAPPMEQRWGRRGFWHVWLVAVGVGGLFTVVAQLIGIGVGPTVGASAGVMGLVAAWSWLQPRARILLMFIFPIEARWILPLAVALDVLFALTGSDTAVAAHLGGIAGTWLVLHGWTRPRLLRTRYNAWKVKRHRQKMRQKMTVLPGGKHDDDEPMVH